MHTTYKTLEITILVIIFISGCARATTTPVAPTPLAPTPVAPAYWPTEGWLTTTPEEQGMDSEKLAQMVAHIQKENLDLHSLLVVRNGNLVTELYPYPYTASQSHWVYSVTKSVVSALVGIAIQQGYIKDVQQPMVSFFPGREIANLDEQKKAITLEHLLTQTSGLECNETYSPDKPVMEASENWVQFMLDQPMVAEPGKQFEYCTAAVHLLSAVIQETTGMPARQFANENLFLPLGIGPILEDRWPSDPQGVSIGGYSLALAPSDMAKLGFLFLNHGQWDGKTMIPSEWVTASTSSHANQGDKKEYGYLWWIDPQGKWYAALGRSGQHIFVYPTENLVVSFTAALPFTNDADLIPLQELLDQYILPAIQSDQPLPANPDGQVELKKALASLAAPQPIEPAALPEIASQISGKTYTLETNPLGWNTLAFTFLPGADTASVLVNGQTPATIGLDNVYRLNGEGFSPFPQGLRGQWENQDTFVGETIVFGQMTHTITRITFAPGTILLNFHDLSTGNQFEIHGSLSDTSGVMPVMYTRAQ